MTETIAILFIFFVLVLFGLVFYYQFQKSGIEEQREQILAEESISISLRATFMPELVCPGTPTRKDCLDIYKLEIMEGKTEEYIDYYFDIFGFAEIVVEEIFPGQRNWTLYQRPLEDFNRRIETPVPMALFNPDNEKYSYGVLKVVVYS